MMTVIITGAAQGIGLAVAQKCLAQAATVIACDIDGPALAQVSRQENSERLVIHECDVSSAPAVKELFIRLGREGHKPTHLVNNAGIFPGKNFLDYTADEFDAVIGVNIRGMLLVAQEFARSLKAVGRGGVIVNTGSVAGHIGSADVLYGTTKAAIHGMTKGLARCLAADGIRANAVAPTIVKTALMKNISDDLLNKYRQGELIKTPVEAPDVAETIWFLLSEESRHFTGAVLDINNGMYLRA